ncbi:MAG TPA: putative glycolipid-binding domain-containing protein [Candidatus Binataceae bacterium]|nr:putative glycolipid-binding domain-containing protein [Candidatus Binataceae bacterium]
MHEILARWQDWSGRSLEHLILKEGADGIVAEAAVLGTRDDHVFAARYKIVCDADWRVKRVEINQIGSDLTTELTSDGAGKWLDGSGSAQPQLENAIDIDLSITPFTNTLPIRRLKLQEGESQEILAVYVQLPDVTITTDRQRYTCLEAGRRYRYESVDSDFTREIEVDVHGLVVNYPGLFRRIL